MTDADKAWCERLAREYVAAGIDVRRAARLAAEQWWARRRAQQPQTSASVVHVGAVVPRVLAAHNVRGIRPAWARQESP